MRNVLAGIVGVIVGLVLGAMAQNTMDDRNIRAGAMTHRGEAYLLIPMDAAKRRQWFARRTEP